MSLKSLSAPILQSSQRLRAFRETREQATVGTISGKGIHTGKNFELVIKAAPQGSGIQFKVPHLGDVCQAPALWTRLSGTTRSTALVLRGSRGKRAELRTIEHLLAALWAYGNVDVEILVSEVGEEDHATDGAANASGGIFEVPILDGSAEAWLAFLQKHSGVVSQKRSRTLRVWRIEKELVVEDGEKHIRFRPGMSRTTSEIEASVDFGPELVQRSVFVADWREPEQLARAFRREIAPARTFGFKHELDELYRRGLAKGGSLNNAILLDGGKVMNPEGFRLENELARHKILDAIGDFALLGAPLIGHVSLHRAGHSLHLHALKHAVDEGAVRAGTLNLDSGQFTADPE